MFIPVLPSRDGGIGNTAHVVIEGVTGAGISDMFLGLSWGVCNPVCGTATNTGFGGAAFGQPNIDGGSRSCQQSNRQVRSHSYDLDDGARHLLFSLPDDGKIWVDGGYGTIYSSNAAEMNCAGTGLYVFHDFTQEIRATLTTNFVRTHLCYADGANAENHRIQMTFFYRF